MTGWAPPSNARQFDTLTLTQSLTTTSTETNPSEKFDSYFITFTWPCHVIKVFPETRWGSILTLWHVGLFFEICPTETQSREYGANGDGVILWCCFCFHRMYSYTYNLYTIQPYIFYRIPIDLCQTLSLRKCRLRYIIDIIVIPNLTGH